MMSENIIKHYFETNETIEVPSAEFFYLSPTGERIPVTENIRSDTEKWTLKEGALTAVTLSATHLISDDVTAVVTPGDGRSTSAVVSGAVDSKVRILKTRPEYTALSGEEVSVSWNADDAVYTRWEADGTKTEKQAERVFKGKEKTLSNDFIQDTTVPVFAEYTKYAKALKTYDKRNADGKIMVNKKSIIEVIHVIGKSVVRAKTRGYVTPEMAMDEELVRQRLGLVTASYHNGEEDKTPVPAENLKYNPVWDHGVITAFEVSAWSGRTDNESTTVTVPADAVHNSYTVCWTAM